MILAWTGLLKASPRTAAMSFSRRRRVGSRSLASIRPAFSSRTWPWIEQVRNAVTMMAWQNLMLFPRPGVMVKYSFYQGRCAKVAKRDGTRTKSRPSSALFPTLRVGTLVPPLRRSTLDRGSASPSRTWPRVPARRGGTCVPTRSVGTRLSGAHESPKCCSPQRLNRPVFPRFPPSWPAGRPCARCTSRPGPGSFASAGRCRPRWFALRSRHRRRSGSKSSMMARTWESCRRRITVMMISTRRLAPCP